MGMKITHVINPVNVGPSSDLFKAQPVTFESMRRARAFVDGELQISFHAACYPEDESLIPDFFDGQSILTSSVLDQGSFLKPRKLPLIGDIINSVEPTSFDYLVYTNVDIALMPTFYAEVAARIKEGKESFIINRRTISTEFDHPDQLNRMYAQAGEIHPGLDCFVMSRAVVEQSSFAKAIIGTTFIGKVLELNCRVLSREFALYTHDHLTFHLGDDRSWRNPDLDDYVQYNKKEFRKVVDALWPISKERGDSGSEAIIKEYLYRFYDWDEDGKNPYLRPVEQSKPDWSTRIKRSIGALMGNT